MRCWNIQLTLVRLKPLKYIIYIYIYINWPWYEVLEYTVDSRYLDLAYLV